MGNQHSASHHSLKPRKNVHWKSAGRPTAPGKPEIVPLPSDEEPNSITLRWRAGMHDGGAPLRGYQVECNRLGSSDWIRTSPPVVLRPELVLSGLEPPHRYQFRVAAFNAVGRSDYSELSDVLNVSPEPAPHRPPQFLQQIADVTTLENDKTEFRVTFTGAPRPAVAWFKDDYEIFSSRRTGITTDETSSVLVFHQTLASDEGEIRCTATNRSGHAVTRARLSIEAAPKLRYPRQYEDGLLYEVNETVFLKTVIVGKPTPTVEWRHDGLPIMPDDRIEISNTPKFSVLKIHAARRSDRGEYQVHARNGIGEDTAAFLVTVTAPPEPPQRVSVARQVDKSVTLDWVPPEDDGGCRIGNYVVEYYRAGWNVWLKATTSRKTNVTLFDLIEGSEYRFRVKAESPYGMSAPSEESAPVRIPGRAVDMDFLAVEARIINDALTSQEGEVRISPAPRRKRSAPAATASPTPPVLSPPMPQRDGTGSNEFMLVLYPDAKKAPSKAEKRESFQLDLDSLSPPPLSLSAPELSPRCVAPFRSLRNSVSSTELLHEHAMARFYKALAMQEEQTKRDESKRRNYDIPYENRETSTDDREHPHDRLVSQQKPYERAPEVEQPKPKPPEIIIKMDSFESDTSTKKDHKLGERQTSRDSETSENKWLHTSFEDDYTASTVSSDSEYSDEGSLNEDIDRSYFNEEETYNPRDKFARPSPIKESSDVEEVSEREILKPLPLPDPNFVPKPILKKREIPELKPALDNVKQKPNRKQILDEKPKKDEKTTLLKKITKMPAQRSFPFPKIINKKEQVKVQENNIIKEKEKPLRQTEKMPDKISDEGRSVIDYYGNIVKEYGTPKKPAVPVYLNTDDLKTVAEKQQTQAQKEIVHNKKVTRVQKSPTNKTTGPKGRTVKTKNANSVHNTQSKPNHGTAENKSLVTNTKEKPSNNLKKCTQQIVLKKTERATIVIPIDYQALEKKAKINVRSAIDYTVDVCLLMLAFWVYLFKDERLAIPFLTLIIYRQLQETFCSYIPQWFRRHTPAWLKKKTS